MLHSCPAGRTWCRQIRMRSAVNRDTYLAGEVDEDEMRVSSAGNDAISALGQHRSESFGVFQHLWKSQEDDNLYTVKLSKQANSWKCQQARFLIIFGCYTLSYRCHALRKLGLAALAQRGWPINTVILHCMLPRMTLKRLPGATECKRNSAPALFTKTYANQPGWEKKPNEP